METLTVKLVGEKSKSRYSHFSSRAVIDGKDFPCSVGKFNIFIPCVQGKFGFKIVKNYPLEDSDSVQKVEEMIRIHQIFHREGLGPEIKPFLVEVEFDAVTLDAYRDILQSDRYQGPEKWFGFYLETLEPKRKPFLIGKAWKEFFRRVESVCLKYEISRRGSTQAAIRELTRNENLFYTTEGFQLIDVDKNFTQGPILMKEKALVEAIQKGGQFPFNQRRRQYQAVDVGDLRLPGGRDFCSSRLAAMGFNVEYFKHASVLDLGCNVGSFCFEAMKQGARLAVGIDVNDSGIESAKRLRDRAGLTNLYFISASLERPDLALLIREVSGDERFDVVLGLSIIRHVKNKKAFANFLDQITAGLLVIEGHANEDHRHYHQFLKRLHFSRIEQKGFSQDRNARPIFFCWK